MQPQGQLSIIRSLRSVSMAIAVMVVFSLCFSCRREAPPPAEVIEPTQSTSPQTTEPATPTIPVEQGAEAEAASSPPAGSAPAIAQTTPSSAGKELYAQHCAACHGERGDSRGVAAAFLFPKPRNFANGSFRLVSTKNNVPTREDLHAVLLRGMPGSAMPPWGHLSQAQRDALIDEVMRLRQEGARDQYTAILKDLEELTDEEIAADDVQEDIRNFVADRTTPGKTSDVPDIPPPTEEVLARGKEVYVKLCQACHGQRGKGDGVKEMFDEDHLPTSARDYTLGIFKGGHDPASLYRRIAYGMPGTPMPASSQLTPDENIALVQFILSLSTEQQRQAALLKREKIVARKVDGIPETGNADAWSSAEPVSLRMVPLWWRNDADPDLIVQALHDGTMIAVRLSWRDETPDLHAARSESFEDAVALEVYRGDAEPFMGMGGPKSPIDVWFWDADRQTMPYSIESEYPRIVADVYPLSETSVQTAEYDRPGTKREAQPELSLPALASGNQIVPSEAASGASTLTVGGPGSVTFRVPRSQIVTARGEWNDGRWNVVMRRSLAVQTEEDGISLEPGESASVAFAVWDGSHQDRDGKKLVTIWQDMQLEP